MSSRFTNACALIASIALACCCQADAALLASWDFNDSSPPNPTTSMLTAINPDADAGIFKSQAWWEKSTLTGTNGGSEANSSVAVYGASYAGHAHPDGTPAGTSFTISGTPNNNRSFIVRSPTTGYGNLQLSYDIKKAFRGYLTHDVDYSVDGATFLPVPDGTGRPNTGTNVTHTLDLSALTVLNDQSMVHFRFTMRGYNPGTASSGVYVRIDNIRIESVPEPVGLTALAGLGWLGRRRRRWLVG